MPSTAHLTIRREIICIGLNQLAAVEANFIDFAYLPGSQLPQTLCMARKSLYFRLIGLVIYFAG